MRSRRAPAASGGLATANTGQAPRQIATRGRHPAMSRPTATRMPTQTGNEKAPGEPGPVGPWKQFAPDTRDGSNLTAQCDTGVTVG